MKLNGISNYLDVRIDRFRAIFFDLDGTLLDSKKEISYSCIHYLNQLKQKYNFHFGIASGRNISSIMPIVIKYQLQNLFDVIVANNGADLVLLNEGVNIELSRISKCKVEEILDKFASLEGITVYFHNSSYLFSTKINKTILDIKKNNYEKSILDPRLEKSYQSPARIVLQADNERYLSNVMKISVNDLKGYHSEPLIYEFVNPEVSKSNGILNYVKRYQKSLDDVLVFGDGDNDVEMLEECKFGIAMKNGVDSAIYAANEVTEFTNDQDGIIKFLKKYIQEADDGELHL